MKKPVHKCLTKRKVHLKIEPSQYHPKEIQALRLKLKLSQPIFAEFLGVSVGTLRAWEQGWKPPATIARRFMDEIDRDPDHFLESLAEKAEFK